MEKNSTFKLIPTFNPVDASNQEVTYESSNTNVVTVDELGNVKAINSGTAKITVMSKENSNIKAECNITVIVSATNLTLSPKSTEIEIGKTVQLSGTIEPGDVTSNALTWSTSNAEIATVNEDGLVTAISAGEVIITASTINGIEDTSVVTVKEPIFQAVTTSNKTLAGNIPQGKFAKGDEYIINVDGTHKYHFYVLSTEGDKVSLIMSNNICSDGTLATETNTCLVKWYTSASNVWGPIAAMDYLHNTTKNWGNISNIQINYIDEGSSEDYGYRRIKTNGNTTIITNKSGDTTATYTDLKARMPKILEIEGRGCGTNVNTSDGSCPAWMVNGLASEPSYYPLGTKEDISSIYGYWSFSSGSSYYYSIRVYDLGKAIDDNVNVGIRNGLRPVIEVLKSDLS